MSKQWGQEAMTYVIMLGLRETLFTQNFNQRINKDNDPDFIGRYFFRYCQTVKIYLYDHRFENVSKQTCIPEVINTV